MKPTENKPGYLQRFQTLAMNRMAPGVVIEKDSLTYWRVRILFTIIIAGLLIGLFALVPSVALVIKQKLWGLLLVDLVAWPFGITVLLSRRLKYEIRAAIALITFYLLGLVIIISVGPLSGGPIWLFTFAVLVGVLLGFKAAIMALCVNAITITITGWLINAGIFGHTFPFFNTMEAMLAAVANFMLLNTIAAISVAVLVKGLFSTYEKEKALYSTLKTERLHLIEAKEKLVYEVEERLHAEKVLRESEKKHRLLAENTVDCIWQMSLDLEFTYINQAVFPFLGYTPEEFIGSKLPEHCSSEEMEKMQAIILDALTNLPENRAVVFETNFYHKNGEEISCEIIGKIELDNTGNPIYIQGTARNITERKQAEEVLRESEEKLVRSKKMESLGLLAGGVAHDLNNVLSGIVSYPELILLDLPEDSKFRKPIETIQESGHRAAAIVQDLLTVARGVATTKEVLNLNDLINGYLNSPEFNKLKQFHPTVTVKTNLDTDLFNISGSHVHIQKVVMNLVSNASEAIEGGGKVTISTMNRYIDIPLRGYDDVNIGEYVVLSVSDDGSGISSVDLERIFEPFYTKKVMGRSGTGLGLAVVWNTVQDHKGYIDVASDENGTAFELYFPITRDEISDKALSVPIKDYKGNQETILVVDDMENQREISCKMLDTLGYKTKAISSGEEAVEYLKENTVDLILLDMIMDPGINGRKTYERIIKIHPKQKAIIVSGFAATDEVRKAQKLGAGQYIKKPVTLEKIGIAVKEELEK
jgi:two-component system, cell cycle sensor histidine kinase and response regulator CckA